MYPKGHISREDEAKIPAFTSYNQAIKWFKSNYGGNLILVDKEIINNEWCYFYDLILNTEDYKKMQNLLQKSGHFSAVELLFSYQRIEIFESGGVHILH